MSNDVKQIVLNMVDERYNCTLSNIKGKQIMYHGVNNGKRIVICTPFSKLHVRGHGWFDLTTKQVDLLDDSDIAVLAIRLQGNKIYYVDFKELKKLMLSDIILNNSREGEHWKLYVWENYINIRGSDEKFHVQPEVLM